MKPILVNGSYATAVAIFALSVAATARAEQASVHFKNGGCVAGELLSYAPGDQVTLRVGEGEPLRFAAAELERVHVSAERASCVPEQVAPVSAPELDARTRALLLRRADLSRQKLGIAGPITLLVAGGLTAILGLGVGLPTALNDCSEYSADSCREDAVISGVAGSIGLLAAVASGYWVRQRLSRRSERTEELRVIDQELAQSGLRVQLSPWLTRGPQNVVGLRARLSF